MTGMSSCRGPSMSLLVSKSLLVHQRNVCVNQQGVWVEKVTDGKHVCMVCMCTTFNMCVCLCPQQHATTAAGIQGGAHLFTAKLGQKDHHSSCCLCGARLQRSCCGLSHPPLSSHSHYLLVSALPAIVLLHSPLSSRRRAPEASRSVTQGSGHSNK